jgi:hypothetical protein
VRRHAPNTLIVGIAAALLTAAAAGVALARPDAAATSPITAAQANRIAKSVADAEITRLAPRLSVSSAGSATAPALYAQVTAAGAVTGNSHGITQANVVHAAPGFYCFVGLPTAPKGGVVNIDAATPGPGSGPDLAQVGLGRISYGRFGTCPEGTQAYVLTFPRDPGPFVDDPFFVVFWS